jgi:hypothetical protein
VIGDLPYTLTLLYLLIYRRPGPLDRDIKTRFGLKAAFDYVVAEKFLDFARAAADHPEFARELPRFVSEVRRMFTPDEISTHIARVELEQRAKDANAAEDR